MKKTNLLSVSLLLLIISTIFISCGETNPPVSPEDSVKYHWLFTRNMVDSTFSFERDKSIKLISVFKKDNESRVRYTLTTKEAEAFVLKNSNIKIRYENVTIVYQWINYGPGVWTIRTYTYIKILDPSIYK